MERSQPTTQLLMRNLESLAGGRILVIDSPDGELGQVLREHLPDAQVTLVQTRYGDARRARERLGSELGDRMSLEFCAWYGGTDRPHDVAVVYLPKGRPMLEMVLEMAAGVLGPPADDGPAGGHGRIFVVGLVRGGIKSSRRALEQRFDGVTKVDAARHCALLSGLGRPRSADGGGLDEWAVTETFATPGCELRVCSIPGVFSHGRLDDGTRMLLETLSEEKPGQGGVLDFGCGCGVIGAWLHRSWPRAEVEMVDSSALALEASRRTAELNGLPAERVYASDVFSDVTDRYRLIVSNPPFHAGITTDYGVVEEFLQGAAAHLRYGGRLRIVANRFHKYRPLLERFVGSCRTVKEDGRFRVYEATVRRKD
ncbi:MAG: class I SAM-dependent methyltransferase [bacterium]|nr:class I SAM-dependent methyltransferase [bacterium]